MLKQGLAGLLLVASGIALLWIFSVIKLNGIVYIVEPNARVLAAELVISAFVLLYGVWRFFDALIKWRDGDR